MHACGCVREVKRKNSTKSAFQIFIYNRENTPIENAAWGYRLCQILWVYCILWWTQWFLSMYPLWTNELSLSSHRRRQCHTLHSIIQVHPNQIIDRKVADVPCNHNATKIDIPSSIGLSIEKCSPTFSMCARTNGQFECFDVRMNLYKWMSTTRQNDGGNEGRT